MQFPMGLRIGFLISGLSVLIISNTAYAAVNETLSKTVDDIFNIDEEETVITVTATRSPIDVSDAPATVTVIDDEQIADELITDIRDLIRFEPGITVRRAPVRFGATLGTTGRAGNEGFNIRGIGGNRVLIQVDGIRFPQGFSFGAQDVGRGNASDIGLIKSVEILRGPSSAFYGSDGLSGAVSFITSDPEDFLKVGKDYGGFVRPQFSSADNEFSETGAIAGKVGDISAMVAYARRDFKELDNEGNNDAEGAARTAPNPQDGKSNAILGKLIWNNSGHKIRLTGEYIERKTFSHILSGQGPVFLFGPNPNWIVDNLTADDRTERIRTSLDWTWNAKEEGAGLIDYAHIAIYWQNSHDRQFTDEDRSPTGSRPRPDRERLNRFDNRVYGANVDLRSRFTTGSTTHKLSFGGDISWTRQRGLRDGVVPPFGEVFPTRAFPVTDFTLGGIFLGDAIEIGEGALTLYPAIRFDFYDLDPMEDPLLPTFAALGQDDSKFSPKIGAVVKLGSNGRLFGHYAKGFRAPTPSQVNNFFENLAFGYTSTPNADLKPETSDSFEAGVRYISDDINLSLTGFIADYDDFISQENVGGSGTAADPTIFQFVNLNSVNVDGIEARASYNAENGFRMRFAMAYANGKVRSSTSTAGVTSLSTIDPLNMVLGMGYRAPNSRFGGDLVATYNARKPADETIGVCSGRAGSEPCFRPKEFIIFDATAFFKVKEGFTIRAGIFNIMDKKYAYWNDVRGLSAASTITDAFTQPGRNVSLSLSAHF